MPSPLNTFLSLEVVTIILEATRIAGAIVVAPLSWANAPVRARASFVVLLTLCCHGQTLAPHALGTSFGLVALAVPTEFLVGAALGFVVRLVVATAEIVGDIIAPQMGLGVAHIFDPQTHVSETALAALLRNFGILLALLAGLHRVLVGGVLASFRLLPPGSVVDPSRATPALLYAAAESMTAGIRIALPIVAVLLLTHTALAFVSRAAPTMQIFSVGFAVTLSVGAAVLVLIAPDFARSVQVEASYTESRMETVLLSLGATPP